MRLFTSVSVVASLAPFAFAVSLVGGCADTAVGTYGGPEVPLAKAPPPPSDVISRSHAHNDSTIELPDDADVVEPAHPAAESVAERSLVHVHSGSKVCSGVALSPRLVATAHQCVAQNARGPVPGEGMRVEVPTSTLTWTTRGVSEIVVPACAWQQADIAVLVLTEPADELKTLSAGTAPGPGGHVQALGYGHCNANAPNVTQRAAPVVDIQSDALVLDLAMCRGDVGGPVFDDASGGVVGIVSHQDDPDGSPRHTTTAMRFDAQISRDLVAQATGFANGGSVQNAKPVSCESAAP